MPSEIEAPRQPAPTTPESSTHAKAPEGLSAFIARVFDQLSVSAWLPSGFLVLGMYSIVLLRLADGQLEATLRSLANTDLAGLALLLGAIVVLTTLTQAFEFGAIRLLEGYWGPGPVRQVIADRLSQRWVRRRETADAERQRLVGLAFASARADFSRAVDDMMVVNFVEADLLGNENMPELDPNQVAVLDQVDWRRFASAASMRRLSEHEQRVERLPAQHRIMPTQLGNTLRAYEDRANVVLEGSVVGMVYRTYHRLPVHMQVEIDQFRNRLGLYATLVATAAVLCVTGILVLLPTQAGTVLLTATVGVVLSFVFYRATVSSADAYGGLLEEVASMQASGLLTTEART